MASLRAKICLILASVLIAGTDAGAQSGDQTLLRAREGAAALMRGQYDKAIVSYDEALTAPEIADFVEASIYSDRGLRQMAAGTDQGSDRRFQSGHPALARERHGL